MTERIRLYHKLMAYGETDAYPYHMPGHKRRQLGDMPEAFLQADITEIDGFDNLHEAEGILRDAQEQANALYGAVETFYLVNGSTAGILSAISATLPEGGHLLMVRGCHRSVYHAAYLRHLRLCYLYAVQTDVPGLQEAITAQAVTEALEQEQDIDAVLIVSPTYEGRIADVRAIAEAVHAKGIPLIVDEAHGAHLGFASGFAEGSCRLGADLVIHSVHKTLPAPTQTALLHVNGSLVDREKLRRFWHIYQSSSPSYLLMAGICDAMEILERDADRLFAAFYKRYCGMLDALASCKVLRFLPQEDIAQGKQDVGKLVVVTDRAGISGQQLYELLRENNHLQCEMAAERYCLAMFTVADGDEAYQRMTRALLEIDRMLAEQSADGGAMQSAGCGKAEEERPEVRYTLTDAWERPWERMRLSDASGGAAADFVAVYPPGIPLLVPGEILSVGMCERLGRYQAQGLRLTGVQSENGDSYIKVLAEH